MLFVSSPHVERIVRGYICPKTKRLPSLVIQSVLISNSISTLEAEVGLIESRNIVVFNTSSQLRVFTEIGKSSVNNRNEVIYELPWMVLTNPYRLKMFHTFEPNRFPLV